MPDKAETVDTGIRDAIDFPHVRGKARLQTAGLLGVHRFRRDAGSLAGRDPARGKVRIVFGQRGKETFSLLHALFADAAHDHVFFNTFARGFGIADRIAGAAVQQPVKARTCAVGKTAHFQKYGVNAAHAQIAQDADPCRAAADNDYRGLFHSASAMPAPPERRG